MLEYSVGPPEINTNVLFVPASGYIWGSALLALRTLVPAVVNFFGRAALSYLDSFL